MAFEQLYKDFSQRDTDLNKLKNEFPFFGPAHFFALQQSNPVDDEYAALAAKAALHFADPLLLHFQLNKSDKAPVTHFASSTPTKEEIKNVEPVYEASAAQPIDNPQFHAPEQIMPLTEEIISEETDSLQEDPHKEEVIYEASAAQPIDNPQFGSPEPEAPREIETGENPAQPAASV